MKTYKLTRQAEADLLEIWHYTAKTWGRMQADRYLRQLESCFKKIAKGEIVGKRPLSSYENLISVRYEHHYVFFLSGEQQVILAVLHEKMDFISRLKNRLEEE